MWGISQEKKSRCGLLWNNGPTVNTWPELSSHCPSGSNARILFTPPHVAYHLCHLLGPGTHFEHVVPTNGSESLEVLSKTDIFGDTLGKWRGRTGWSDSIKFSIFESLLSAWLCARHAGPVCDVIVTGRSAKWLFQKFSHKWGLRIDNENRDEGVNAKQMLT